MDMEKVKQNSFWIGLGGAGGVLVIFFVMFVYPTWGEISTKRMNVRNLKTTLGPGAIFTPSPQDIGAWEKRGGEYVKAYQDILKYYRENDTGLEKLPDGGTKKIGIALETWFSPLKNPASSQFDTKYKDKKKELEKQVTDKGVAIGIPLPEDADPDDTGFERYGFNWEKPTLEEWNAIGDEKVRAPIVKMIQKRFWIRTRIGKAAMASNVRRIRDVRFFKVLHRQIPGPSGMPEGVFDYPNDPTKLRLGTQKFMEWLLPDSLGDTISFGFTIDILYGDLPGFIRKFLQPNMSPKLMIDIAGMRSYILKQNALEAEVQYMPGREDPKRKIDAFHQGVKPVAVTVQFTCRVIDFDSENAGKPKPAAKK